MTVEQVKIFAPNDTINFSDTEIQNVINEVNGVGGVEPTIVLANYLRPIRAELLAVMHFLLSKMQSEEFVSGSVSIADTRRSIGGIETSSANFWLRTSYGKQLTQEALLSFGIVQ